MSPIFNHHALRGLSSATLNHLRGIILHLLGAADLSDSRNAQLHAALADIHAVLRSRQLRLPPRHPDGTSRARHRRARISHLKQG